MFVQHALPPTGARHNQTETLRLQPVKDGGGVGNEGGSRQGGKLNVTSHIWLFTSHLADTSKISGGKITGLILLDKGPASVPAHLLFQACKFYTEAL